MCTCVPRIRPYTKRRTSLDLHCCLPHGQLQHEAFPQLCKITIQRHHVNQWINKKKEYIKVVLTSSKFTSYLFHYFKKNVKALDKPSSFAIGVLAGSNVSLRYGWVRMDNPCSSCRTHSGLACRHSSWKLVLSHNALRVGRRSCSTSCPQRLTLTWRTRII